MTLRPALAPQQVEGVCTLTNILKGLVEEMEGSYGHHYTTNAASSGEKRSSEKDGKEVQVPPRLATCLGDK